MGKEACAATDPNGPQCCAGGGGGAVAAKSGASNTQKTAGLAEVTGHTSFPYGTLIAYSAPAGRPAATLVGDDSNPKEGSLFTHFLAPKLATEDTVLGALGAANLQIVSVAGKAYEPWNLITVGSAVVLAQDKPLLVALEEDTWQRSVRAALGWTKDSRWTREVYENLELLTYLSQYPAGLYAQAARDRIRANNGVIDLPVKVTGSKPHEAPGNDTIFTGALASISGSAVQVQAARGPDNARPQPFRPATATIRLDLFARGGLSTVLGNKIVGSIEPGEQVMVVRKTTIGDWALVVTADGQQGYLNGVQQFDLSGLLGATVVFDTSQINAITDDAPIRTTVEQAMRGDDQVVVRVGPSSAADAGVASLVAYNRSLGLRERMQALGLPAHRIVLLNEPAANVSVDQARLFLLPTRVEENSR